MYDTSKTICDSSTSQLSNLKGTCVTAMREFGMLSSGIIGPCADWRGLGGAWGGDWSGLGGDCTACKAPASHERVLEPKWHHPLQPIPRHYPYQTESVWYGCGLGLAWVEE